MMWNQAKAWGYVQHEPFTGLVLPDRNALNERCLSQNPIVGFVRFCRSLDHRPHLGRVRWVRAGEIGGLPVTDLFLDQGAIRVSQSVWLGTIQLVKSKKGNGICEISPRNLLFATSNGTPLDTDTLRKRKLYPLLKKRGFSLAGFMPFGTVTRR